MAQQLRRQAEEGVGRQDAAAHRLDAALQELRVAQAAGEALAGRLQAAEDEVRVREIAAAQQACRAESAERALEAQHRLRCCLGGGGHANEA